MDAVDEVVLTQAAELAPDARRVLTIDDTSGELTRWAAARADVVAYADSLAVERAVHRQRAEEDTPAERTQRVEALLADTDLVLARLPKSLAALDEYAALVARHASTGVTFVAGGRVKHMTRGMNDVLARHFGDVRASLGLRKARALIASDPRPGPADWPAQQRHDDLGLTVCAHGACFGGTKIDLGTRLLLGALAAGPVTNAPDSPVTPDLPASRGTKSPATAVDLGCGNGTIAAWLALRGVRVTAVDESRAACASTAATAEANGVADLVDVRRADGLEDIAAGSRELIVCNPPFHVGTAKDSSVALAMIRDAGRVLRPGGELWLVFNAHLPYLPALRRHVGGTEIVARDPKFIVTRSVRG